MAAFFITSVLNKGSRPFQFAFETNEARDIAEFRELLESGSHILGRRTVSRIENQWEDCVITGAVVAMVNVHKPAA